MSIFSLFSQSIIKESFTFFDVETTGLYPLSGDRVIEIAMIKTKNGEKVDTLELLINPGFPISQEVTRINNISDEMVKDAPIFSEELADKILKFIDGTVLVAHNAPFDIGFLSAEFARLGIIFEGWSAIDTLKISREILQIQKHRLENLVRHYGIVASGDFHRALFDTECLMKVFFNLMEEEYFNGKNIETVVKKFGIIGQNIYRSISARIREAIIDKMDISCKYKKRDGNIVEFSFKPLAPVWAYNKWYIMAQNGTDNKILSLNNDSFVEILN